MRVALFAEGAVLYGATLLVTQVMSLVGLCLVLRFPEVIANGHASRTQQPASEGLEGEAEAVQADVSMPEFNSEWNISGPADPALLDAALGNRTALAHKWSVSVPAIAAAAKLVAKEWGLRLRDYESQPHLLTGLVLIYVKRPWQVFDGVSVDARVWTLIDVLRGEGKRMGEANEHLERLVVQAHDTGAPAPPAYVQAAIDAFYAAVPEWSSPSTSTVLCQAPTCIACTRQATATCTPLRWWRTMLCARTGEVMGGG